MCIYFGKHNIRKFAIRNYKVLVCVCVCMHVCAPERERDSLWPLLSLILLTRRTAIWSIDIRSLFTPKSFSTYFSEIRRILSSFIKSIKNMDYRDKAN